MDCDVSANHIDSFNFLLEKGARLAACSVPPVKLRLPNNDALEFSYTDARIGYPRVADGTLSVTLI